MTDEFNVSSWEECEAQLQSLLLRHTDKRQRIAFRGQADATWDLSSTLERRFQSNQRVASYFALIRGIRSELEALTAAEWKLPERSDAEETVDTQDSHELEKLFIASYPYLAHLRHHGFPSPLLDWTLSIYVAAYFAFARPPAQASHVAIFAFSGMPFRGKDWSSRNAKIGELGPRVKTHRRHFRQKSQYTYCVRRDDSDWKFAPHKEVFDLQRQDQDLLWKYVIPVTERTKALRRLEQMNINAFSLFDSEDALLETLAIREIDLRD